MKIAKHFILAGTAGLFLLTSCKDENMIDSTPVDGEIVLQTSLFSTHSRVGDFELVDCTLSDGTVTQCYKVTYKNSPESWGPGCPETIDDVGGVGFYDDKLQALDADLWDQFAADGYDIVNEDGTINVVVPSGPPGSGGSPAGSSNLNGSCLDAELDESLTITYYIPAYPVKLSSSSEINTVGFWGLSIDGFPYAPPPPSTLMNGMAAIPALDPCGGHPEPNGAFHWHIIPQEANNILDAYGIDNVTCTNIAQSSTTVIGYAQDGFPVYGSMDSGGSTPSDLDACNGHTTVTDEYPDGIYHYHISATDAPNILTCIYGATVSSHDFWSYN